MSSRHRLKRLRDGDDNDEAVVDAGVPELSRLDVALPSDILNLILSFVGTTPLNKETFRAQYSYDYDYVSSGSLPLQPLPPRCLLIGAIRAIAAFVRQQQKRTEPDDIWLPVEIVFSRMSEANAAAPTTTRFTSIEVDRIVFNDGDDRDDFLDEYCAGSWSWPDLRSFTLPRVRHFLDLIYHPDDDLSFQGCPSTCFIQRSRRACTASAPASLRQEGRVEFNRILTSHEHPLPLLKSKYFYVNGIRDGSLESTIAMFLALHGIRFDLSAATRVHVHLLTPARGPARHWTLKWFGHGRGCVVIPGHLWL